MSATDSIRTSAVWPWVRQLVGPECLVDRPQGVHKLLTILERLFEPVDPAFRRPLGKNLPSSIPLHLVSVYRQRNTSNILQIIDDAAPVRAALWALDAPEPRLAAYTLGSGPGERLPLLNRLISSLPHDPTAWLVVADDDFLFTHGDIRRTLEVARRSNFDLCQPSHGRRSHVNWSVTRHHFGLLSRQTRFVDQGPLLLLGPVGQAKLLPFPEDLGMGWGIEATWAADSTVAIGIVDACAISHLSPVVRTNYDVDREWQQALKLLRRNGFDSWQDIQCVLSTWPTFRPHPSKSHAFG